MNRNDQFAFTANFTAPDVGIPESSEGLFAEDAAGKLHLIVRGGDNLDISDDPSMPKLRRVRSFKFFGNTGNEDGRGSGFNERGQIAFYAEFFDGTAGIFVSNLVAVPEPDSLAVIVLAALIVGVGYRRV